MLIIVIDSDEDDDGNLMMTSFDNFAVFHDYDDHNDESDYDHVTLQWQLYIFSWVLFNGKVV